MTTIPRARRALFLAALCATACHHPAPTPPPGGNPLREAARAAVATGCRTERPPPEPPAYVSEPGARPFDVVVFTAHPDDEAMYAGGTLRRLADAGRRVLLVPLSHGEGGRLLEPGADGGFVERRDLPLERVVAVRDAELVHAAAVEGAALAFVNRGEARVDYGFTTSCDEALSHWDRDQPGGVARMLRAMVDLLRARRPRVVLTLDPRDDPQASHHGHHKAVGVLAELAARLAADPRVPLGEPVVVDEVLSFAPLGVAPDVAVVVDPAARRAALLAYPSQFRPDDLLSQIALRPVEGFVLRYRARGLPAPSAGSVLNQLIARPDR